MTPIELREVLGTLGIAQHRCAALFGRAPRTVRHWAFGDRSIPHEAGLLLRLMHAGKITAIDVEEADAPSVAATLNRSTPQAWAPPRRSSR
jgi:hypothetical protein